MRAFDPARAARRWRRPYTSVQRAWVDALGIEPSREWAEGSARVRRRVRARDAREAMRQRHGVRGL